MPKKENANTIQANSRGYAYLGKLENCPDLSKVKKAEFAQDEKTGVYNVKLNKGDDCGNMLRRGYLHIGGVRTALFNWLLANSNS